MESQLFPNADKEGRQADVIDELNTIRSIASPVPAKNSCITSPPIPRDSLLALVDGNLNCISEMSAINRRRWADHREDVKGNWKLGPETLLSGNGRCSVMIEEDEEIPYDSPNSVRQWLQGSSKDSVTGNASMAQVPLVFNNDEKTWADLAGTEENVGTLESDLIALIDENLRTPMSKLSITSGSLSEWSESRDDGVFTDENYKTNIINCTPTHSLVRSPYRADCFRQQNLQMVHLKGPLGTPPYSTLSSLSDAAAYKKLRKSSTPFSTEWTSSARRSLSFGKHDQVEGCTAALPKTVIGDSGHLQAMGSGANFGMDVMPKKLPNRLSNQRSWRDGDAFPDQNFNTNIIRCTPHPLARALHYTDCFQQQKPETGDLKGLPGTTAPYVTTPSAVSGAADHKKDLVCTPFSTGFARTASTIRRSISFGKQDQVEGCTTTLPKTVDIGDCSYLQAGSGSSFGMDMKLKQQGNRLRVFQEITLPDSPGA